MLVETVKEPHKFEITYPVVIIGAGACGLCAALAVRDIGRDVLVLEQDKTPLGTTGMSTGLIPAAGTSEQDDAGIKDSPSIFSQDILSKTNYQADAKVVGRLAQESAETISWLRDQHQVPLSLVSGFTYPGHSVNRMYGTPHRSGAELMAALEAAANNCGVDILTESLVEDLIVDMQNRVLGIRYLRPNGETEEVGCDALILACCGFAGNESMVAQYIPEMTEAVFYGHPGNKGHAIYWGQKLNAQLGDMGAYQGHGGLAYGHGIPILWPSIMQGGFQVNMYGERFSDESKGYSEQSVNVLEQPEGIAWSIFDERIYQSMLDFDDFNQAVNAGAVTKAATLAELASHMKVPLEALARTVGLVAGCANGDVIDQFQRDFSKTPMLKAPYFCARVTGALFHTQGGLLVNEDARVMASDGTPLPNLFAGGGAARGISGPGGDGYIAGNGLLTATSFGKIAGRCAATQLSE
ncbi:MAG: FAD-dependent oxidoreductase [Acidiferrobacterales bacterium]|nr:FAD-dependent oxidoreductase [Acidiferrobacterales bacterium]